MFSLKFEILNYEFAIQLEFPIIAVHLNKRGDRSVEILRLSLQASVGSDCTAVAGVICHPFEEFLVGRSLAELLNEHFERFRVFHLAREFPQHPDFVKCIRC